MNITTSTVKLILSYKKDETVENTSKKIEKVFLSIALIIIAGVVINIGYAIGIALPIKNKLLVESIVPFFSAPIGFIIIPLLLNKCFNYFDKKVKFNFLQAIILAVFVLILSIFVLHSNEIAHDFIIAVCEEFLFRHIIFNILNTEYQKKYTYLIGSLLFGTLLHLNGDFLINFATKFPAGLLLYFLADHFGLQSSIAFHWLYNMLVGYFFG